MHADEIEELRCSHAFRVVLYRVPCSCQQSFHVFLLKFSPISQGLAGLPGEPRYNFSFLLKLLPGLISTLRVLHFVND